MLKPRLRVSVSTLSVGSAARAEDEVTKVRPDHWNLDREAAGRFRRDCGGPVPAGPGWAVPPVRRGA